MTTLPDAATTKTEAVPRNRPCDWCEKPVTRGYIHKKCAEKERDMIWELLYG